MSDDGFENDRQRLAYFAWRAIRDRQDQLTPSRRCTWLQWFKEMYANELDAVRERLYQEGDQ